MQCSRDGYVREQLALAAREYAPREKVVTAANIKAAVAERFDVSVSLLNSKKRDRWICYPRQTAMYLARTVAKKTYPEIGHLFARHHTTVMDAVAAVTARRLSDAKLDADIRAIEAAL
jgi:chromosomal replication initiator protein